MIFGGSYNHFDEWVTIWVRIKMCAPYMKENLSNLVMTDEKRFNIHFLPLPFQLFRLTCALSTHQSLVVTLHTVVVHLNEQIGW